MTKEIFKINKLKLKRIILGLLAIFFGVMAAFLSNYMLKEKIAEIEQRQLAERKVTVIVAKKQITPGMRLGEHNLATRSVPEQWVPSYAISADNFPQIDNQISAYALSPGDMVIPLSSYSLPISEKEHTHPPASQIKASAQAPEKSPATAKVVVLYGNEHNTPSHPTALP